MANEYVTYTRTGETRYLDGEIANVSEVNEVYFEGKLQEHRYNRRLRKDETIRGRAIMNEDDYSETVIDAFSGMENL